jgi:hypothetical protein
MKESNLRTMSVLDQLIKQIEALSPDQRQTLFLRLGEQDRTLPQGIPGSSILELAGNLDSVSARKMIEAIESECEKVDAREW